MIHNAFARYFLMIAFLFLLLSFNTKKTLTNVLVYFIKFTNSTFLLSLSPTLFVFMWFATSFYKVFSLYMLFSVSAISSKLKMLENFPAKKKKKKKGFADRPTLFFSAREPETQLFFFGTNNIFISYLNTLNCVCLKKEVKVFSA